MALTLNPTSGTDLVGERPDSYTAATNSRFQYTDLRDKLDGEYEEYVRCKIQDLINQEDYFQAKNLFLLE
jgi:hypothetical protein